MSIDCKEANLLEAIRVVSELPDVFPEDLPGMPPECKVRLVKVHFVLRVFEPMLLQVLDLCCCGWC